MMIFLVFVEVLGQLRDTRRQQRDLDFRRTRVGFILPIPFNYFSFLYSRKRHYADLMIRPTSLFIFKNSRGIVPAQSA